MSSGRKERWIVRLVCALMLMFQLALAGCNSGGQSVSAQTEKHPSMNPPEASITASSAGDDIAVTVVLVNRGAEPFPLLRWNLPADGRLTGSLFEVYRNGVTQQYFGEMVKRSVTSDDYLLLQPGKEYRTTISLKQAYDVKASGEYRIGYRAWNQLPGGGLATITSPVVTVKKGG